MTWADTFKNIVAQGGSSITNFFSRKRKQAGRGEDLGESQPAAKRLSKRLDFMDILDDEQPPSPKPLPEDKPMKNSPLLPVRTGYQFQPFPPTSHQRHRPVNRQYAGIGPSPPQQTNHVENNANGGLYSTPNPEKASPTGVDPEGLEEYRQVVGIGVLLEEHHAAAVDGGEAQITSAEAPETSRKTFTKSRDDILAEFLQRYREQHRIVDDVVLTPSSPQAVVQAREAELAKRKYEQRQEEKNQIYSRVKVVVSRSKLTGERLAQKEKQLLEEEALLRRLRLEEEAGPKITEEDRAQYDSMTHKPKDYKAVTHPRTSVDIKGHDMASLRPATWLNDEIINFSMTMLQDRDTRRREEGLGPKCHFFNSFFLTNLYQKNGTYNYNEVRRWTLPVRLKRAGQASESILDCDRILIPCNIGSSHWTCAMIDIENEEFVYFDSMGQNNTACLANLAKYLRDEYKNKRNEDREDVLDWPRRYPKDIPQQQNGYDCGMFTILFADYAARKAPMNFSQEHIQDFRVRAVRDIMRVQME